jgi:hypothetical protein
MSARFLPLTGSTVYAQSVGAEAPFIVAAMFTENARQYAERLKSSLEQVGLSFALYQVPTVHRSISHRGSADIAFCKPNFIQYVRTSTVSRFSFSMQILLFANRRGKSRMPPKRGGGDFACYNWLADTATDAYKPLPGDNRIYRFSHAIDLFDPTQLLTSGAALYFTPGAQPLLQSWFDAIARFPGVIDDQLLDYAYNYAIDKRSIRASWWDKDYCRYAWWIHVRPVIDHPQFPATREVKVHFKQAAGHERFRPETITVRASEAPFPRDCLIDTSEKCLVRIHQGAATVVGRFVNDLWIDRTTLG